MSDENNQKKSWVAIVLAVCGLLSSAFNYLESSSSEDKRVEADILIAQQMEIRIEDLEEEMDVLQERALLGAPMPAPEPLWGYPPSDLPDAGMAEEGSDEEELVEAEPSEVEIKPDRRTRPSQKKIDFGSLKEQLEQKRAY